jgi:hypothetical protein
MAALAAFTDQMEPDVENLYTLRLYDRFDGWIDHFIRVEPKSDEHPVGVWRSAVPLSVAEAEMAAEIERDKKYGREQVYGEHYWHIFPADTTMLQRPETMDR